MYNISKILAILMIFLVSTANAALEPKKPKQMLWPFAGIFGKVDRQSAQRGAQVYFEVCAVCHGLNHLYYRNLRDIGFSDAEIKEIAKSHTVIDGPNEDGEMFERPGILSGAAVRLR